MIGVEIGCTQVGRQRILLIGCCLQNFAAGHTEVMERNVAEHIIEFLAASGVPRVHALPGEENLDIVEALRTSAITVVVHRHEQNAAFTAAAEGRLSGRPGVCLATLGPGATNLFTGLAHAHLGGFPMLAFTGQKPALDNSEGSFQVIDVVAAAEPLVKAAVRLDDPMDVGGVMEAAWRTATTGRPGPVLIELPEDVAGQSVEVEIAPGIFPPVATSVPTEDLLAGAVAAINNARRPVMLVSEHGNRRAVSDAVVAFAEATGIGVLSTQLGSGAIDARHSNAIGTLGIHRPDHAHLGLYDVDLVVAVGYDPVEHPPLAWNPEDQIPVMHVAAWPARPERGYRPFTDLVGDPAATLECLAERIVSRPDGDVMVRKTVVSELLDEEEPATRETAPSEAEALTPLDVVGGVRSALDDRDVVVLDNGAYKVWFARHWRATEPQTLLMDNALATMGAGLGTGMAAALYDADRRTVVVTGDGGFLMNVQDLATVGPLGIDLTIIVVRDDAFGFIAWHQDEQDFERSSVALDNPDLLALSQAFGASVARVNTKAALAAELERSKTQSGLHVIECPINYSINEMLDGSADAAIERYQQRRDQG